MTDAFTADAARALGGPEWLVRRRLEAAERLGSITWPTPSEEIWRYSRIDQLDLDRFRPFAAEELGAPGDERAPGGGPWAAEAGKHTGMIVVHDGRVVHHELDPALEAKGVRACGIATCDDDLVSTLIGRASGASEDAFTVLHDAFLAGGAFVHVPAGVVVEDPILVLHWCEGDGRASFPHTLVSLGEGAEATVLDRFGSPQTDHLVDAVTELLVGDGAHLRYLSVQEHGTRTWHLGLLRAHVSRDATLRTSAVALGGDYARLRSEALLTGQGAESDQLAVYFGDGKQMLDFRTLQDHDAPNTRSDLLFKGAVEDTARSVYSGLVHLRPAAKKANASQTNRNLVLTEGASAESIPNLEIEANDVRCSHASTVGPIDDDQLYYLEPRGIPPEEAERLIVLGFFDDVFERLPVGALTRGLRRSVVDKLEHARGEAMMGTVVRLCSRDELAPGTARRFDVDGHCVALVRIGDDFYAIADRCSHADYSLSEGDVWDEEREIECPKHGSTFSLITGEPQTLPATQPVPVYATKVDGDDVSVVLPCVPST